VPVPKYPVGASAQISCWCQCPNILLVPRTIYSHTTPKMVTNIHREVKIKYLEVMHIGDDGSNIPYKRDALSQIVKMVLRFSPQST